MKKYEFWHPRVFEAPYYAYLGWQCLLNGIGIRSLAKANYCLDHGEIGIGSKLATQLAFNQSFFLPTMLLEGDLALKEKEQRLRDFAAEHHYPIILKSNVGCVGKGVCKLHNDGDLMRKVPLLLGDYIVQKFTPLQQEYGVFYVRHRGQPRITGINRKHFPTIIGNGRDNIISLAKAHHRYTDHWHTFLQYFDHRQVPDEGEELQLSFIGSHTMGCMFTDDTHLLTPALEQAVFRLFEEQPGYNFGRLDIKTADEQAFRDGDFVLIEVNGIASLPTHMFDPKYSVWQAYRIFFRHARHLAQIANEHRAKPMEFLSFAEIIERVRTNQGLLNQVHNRLMGR